MTLAVDLELDADSAGQLAVALHALATRNRQQHRVYPAALAALQAAAEHVVQTGQPARLTITNPQQPAVTGTRSDHREDGTNELLTRNDVARITSVSTDTVDRWTKSGKLASTRHGRIRRIKRADLDAFLNGAA